MNGKPRQQGYTVIEMVLIVTIILIIAATAVSRLSLPDITLNAVGDMMAYDIRLTQIEAIGSGKVLRMIFKSDSSKYNYGVAKMRDLTTIKPSLIIMTDAILKYSKTGNLIDTNEPVVITIVDTQRDSKKFVIIMPGTGRVEARNASQILGDMMTYDIEFTRTEAIRIGKRLSITYLSNFSSYDYGIDKTRDLAAIKSSLRIMTDSTLIFGSTGKPLGMKIPLVVTVVDTQDGSKKYIVIMPGTGTASAQNTPEVKP